MGINATSCSRAILALALISFAHIGSAADEHAEARALYNSGTTHYNLREFKEALADFTSAYRLTRDPVFLFNIAQCHRQLDDPESAAAFYRAYRREMKDLPNRDEVERLIAEMDRMAAQRRERSDAATTSNHAPVTAPAPRDITPQQSDSTQNGPVLVQPNAATSSVSGHPISEHAVLIATRPSRPLAKRPLFWGLLTTGVVVVAAAITLGVVFGRSSGPSASLGRTEGP